MSSRLKRTISTDEGPISPPPIRRKLSPDKLVGSQEAPCHPDNHLRIFSWNVNGIGPFLQPPIFFSGTYFTSPLRSFLARHSWPQIVCLQEVKINRKDTATQRALQNAANLDPLYLKNAESRASSNPTYTVHFALPRDKYNATGFSGKVHGVATLIRDDLSQCLAIPNLTSTTGPVAWDLEGRVLITTLSIPSPSSQPAHLSLLHAYWPNGTTLRYRCPTTGATQGTRHDHKLRFHRHMLSEALSLQSQSQSHHVLLIGDMNIAPQPIDGHPNLRTSPHQHVINRADFNAKFLDPHNLHGLAGVDVWRYLRGPERKYTYFPRGQQWGSSCDRVDLVVAGKGLVEREEEEGGELEEEGGKGPMLIGMQIYDNELDRGHSDHVPLSVTLDLGPPRTGRSSVRK